MQESMSIGDLIAGILASVIPIFNIIVAVAFIADLLNRVEFTVFDTVIWRKKHVSQQ